jgi:hypothetical protein
MGKLGMDELVKKKYRYWGNGQTGIANDAYTARFAAARSAGVFAQHAYDATTTVSPSTSGTQPANPAQPVPTGSGSLISQTVDYTTGESKTSYQGVPAYRIDISTANISVPAGQTMPNPVDVTENGVLIGWTVAVNDPSMKITSIIYGDNSTSTTLWDDTIQAITYLGRGLTQGAAEAVAPGQYQYSLDQAGVKDDIWPWIQRYRSTYSLYAIQNMLTYAQVAGTADDIWLVAAYTPSIKEGYSRVSLSVTNTGSNNRLILRLQMSRIKFQPTTTPVYTSASGDYAHAGEWGGEDLEPTFSDTLI